MNEETVKTDVPSYAPDELKTLKARADMLGIKYHPNSKARSLRAKIEAKLAVNPDKPKVADPIDDASFDRGKFIPGKGYENVQIKPGKRAGNWLTDNEHQIEIAKKRRSSLNRLIRCKIACLNPNKRDWEGEIISVGSAKAGTFKKFVPFNNEEGYHLPVMIYEALLDRQFTQFTTVRGPRGEKIRKGKLVPEFNIEVLTPLTKKELHELGQRQLAAHSID